MVPLAHLREALSSINKHMSEQTTTTKKWTEALLNERKKKGRLIPPLIYFSVQFATATEQAHLSPAKLSALKWSQALAVFKHRLLARLERKKDGICFRSPCGTGAPF